MLAHAFGERYEAPVPLGLFLVAGGLAVVASFVFVLRREVAPRAPRVVDTVVAPRGGPVWGTLSVLGLAGTIASGLLGSQVVSENITPALFWLVVWVGVPLVVGLVGDFTGPLNPFAALSRVADNPGVRQAVLGSRDPLPWPRAAGWWVAALGFAVVTVGELVVNGLATLPRVTALGLAVYAVLCMAASLVFGSSAWTTRGELFSVTYATWGRLGYWRFRAAGRQGFGGGLDVPFDPSTGRLAQVALLLVAVSFDGVLSTSQWLDLVRQLPAALRPGTYGYIVFAVAFFALLTAATLVVFGAFATAAARVGGSRLRGRAALAGLLPSLVPIAYGYLIAHYLQYVLINGQLMLPLIGNPLGTDSWPVTLGYPFSEDFEPRTDILPNSVNWYIQVLAVVLAHVAAVVLAHRHLAHAVPAPTAARRSEYPWLVAMVAYTMLSLWLLAQPVLASHAEEALPQTPTGPTATAGLW